MCNRFVMNCFIRKLWMTSDAWYVHGELFHFYLCEWFFMCDIFMTSCSIRILWMTLDAWRPHDKLSHLNFVEESWCAIIYDELFDLNFVDEC